MSELSQYADRIVGFAEYADLLAWPRTQVANRLKRERERSEFWVPGQIPRPFVKIRATTLYDLEEIYAFLASPEFKEHNPYPRMY